jgi:hypothetical protein
MIQGPYHACILVGEWGAAKHLNGAKHHFVEFETTHLHEKLKQVI